MEKMDCSSCSLIKRRKIPMQKRETKEQRAVTFSKRRAGLFNKAAELCVLCSAQVVILVSAPLAKRQKFYTFAHPDINLLLDSFLNNHVPYPIRTYNNPSSTSLLCQTQNMDRLTPQDNKESKTKKRKRECEGFWWDNEDFDAYQTPEELDLIIAKLEKLREDVALRLQKFSSVTDQDITTYDHQNHHAVEDTVNVNREYGNKCDDQDQFIPSVMLRDLSTSTYFGGCLGQDIVSTDGYKGNADLMQMVPMKSIIVKPNINNDGQHIGNYHYDMRTTFKAPSFSSNGAESCAKSNFGEDTVKVNHEYSNKCDDQVQFIPSVMLQELSTSTYHGGCLSQNIVSIDGYKSGADLMQMVPLKSIIVAPNINNDSQYIGNYHYDMRTAFEAPFFSSNGVETCAKSNFGWMDDKVTTPYIQNEQPSSFFSNGLHRHVGTSFGWGFGSNNHSFLQDSNIGFAPPFSSGNKDADTYNCHESNFEDKSVPSSSNCAAVSYSDICKISSVSEFDKVHAINSLRIFAFPALQSHKCLPCQLLLIHLESRR